MAHCSENDATLTLTAQSSLLFYKVKRCFFQPQNQWDAYKPQEADGGEDGLTEVLAHAHHSQAHGGQHAQSAGHHPARVATQELVASHHGHHRMQEQQRE